MACSSHKTDGFLNVLSSISRKHEYDNRKKAEELLRFVGLEADGYSAAGSLSYGQQKLLTLACCLALDSKLMMLDEPVAGINPETILKILDLFNELKKRGVTIFFIEHNIDAVMTASDRIIVMTEGRVVADGAPNSVRDDPIVVEAYLS
jgi:branched-chain amino acid transport system ATP-binding protein